jgi:hypothetical protein
MVKKKGESKSPSQNSNMAQFSSDLTDTSLNPEESKVSISSQSEQGETDPKTHPVVGQQDNREYFLSDFEFLFNDEEDVDSIEEKKDFKEEVETGSNSVSNHRPKTPLPICSTPGSDKQSSQHSFPMDVEGFGDSAFEESLSSQERGSTEEGSVAIQGASPAIARLELSKESTGSAEKTTKETDKHPTGKEIGNPSEKEDVVYLTPEEGSGSDDSPKTPFPYKFIVGLVAFSLVIVAAAVYMFSANIASLLSLVRLAVMILSAVLSIGLFAHRVHFNLNLSDEKEPKTEGTGPASADDLSWAC